MAMFRSSGEIESRLPKSPKNEMRHGDRAVHCDFCVNSWDSETEVEIHRNTTHKEELLTMLRDPTKQVCRVCIKPYKDKDELVRHIKTCHLLSSADAVRVEREMFVCDGCCAVFFNKHLLQSHVLIFHTNKDRGNTFTECPKCLKLYRLKTIWYHFQGHNIQSVSCCKVCLTKCKDRKELLQHVDSHIKHLYCDICQYQSKNEAYFKEHLTKRHGRVKNTNKMGTTWRPYFLPKGGDYKLKFQCDTAIKGLHLELFADVDLRVCLLCREICVGQKNAVEHIESEHMCREPKPKTPYECTCGETYNNKVLLKHHIFKNKGDHAEVSEEQDVIYTIVLVSDDSDVTPTTT